MSASPSSDIIARGALAHLDGNDLATHAADRLGRVVPLNSNLTDAQTGGQCTLSKPRQFEVAARVLVDCRVLCTGRLV